MLDKIMAVYMTIIITLGSFLGIGGYSRDYKVFSDIVYSDKSERNIQL